MTALTPKRRRALEDARAEAGALLREWQEIVQHHRLLVQAQFTELEKRLAPAASARQSKGLPSGAGAESILATLKRVRVKAAKGRAKDLRRIESALHEALGLLPSE